MLGTFTIAKDDMDTQALLASGYHLGCGLMAVNLMIFVGLNASTIMRNLIKATLDNTPEGQRDPRMVNIVGKLNVCIRELRNNGISNPVGSVLFAFWGYLANKHSYQLVFAWILICPIISAFMWFLNPNKKRNKLEGEKMQIDSAMAMSRASSMGVVSTDVGEASSMGASTNNSSMASSKGSSAASNFSSFSSSSSRKSSSSVVPDMSSASSVAEASVVEVEEEAG